MYADGIVIMLTQGFYVLYRVSSLETAALVRHPDRAGVRGRSVGGGGLEALVAGDDVGDLGL